MLFKRKRLGFVDIIMMVVALAIAATAAIPGYVNSRNDTKQNSVDGVAGALGSASAINFAVRNISRSHGVAVANCSDVIKTLEGSLNEDYQIIAAPIKPGAKTECTVVDRSGTKATFIAQGIS